MGTHALNIGIHHNKRDQYTEDTMMFWQRFILGGMYLKLVVILLSITLMEKLQVVTLANPHLFPGESPYVTV